MPPLLAGPQNRLALLGGAVVLEQHGFRDCQIVDANDIGPVHVSRGGKQHVEICSRREHHAFEDPMMRNEGRCRGTKARFVDTVFRRGMQSATEQRVPGGWPRIEPEAASADALNQ